MSLQRLATPIENTGWIALTKGSATTGHYCRVNGVVFLRIDLGAPQNISVDSSGVVLGTLPDGFRPIRTMYTAATGKGSVTGGCQLSVSTDGTVTGYVFGTARVYFGASVSFPNT